MNDDEVEISARRFLDGYEIFINAKGASAKEAYANLEQYAEDLGCAPAVRYELKSGAAPTIAAPAAEKPGRVRRTKEQIAADEAAAKAANTPPSLPPTIAAPVNPAFATPPAAPASPPLNAPVVALAPGAPIVNPPAGVTLSPPSAPPAPAAPPAPVATPEQQARDQINAEVKALFDSVPGTWLESVTQAVNGFVRTNGGDVAMMTMAQLQAYAGQVAAYRKQCDTAQGK